MTERPLAVSQKALETPKTTKAVIALGCTTLDPIAEDITYFGGRT